MEHEPVQPENKRRILIQREQKMLFEAMARTLVMYGTHEPVHGVYTPADRPDALAFRIDPDISLVKSIFYPDDDRFELEEGDVYLNYMTPHALAENEIEDQASSVYLHLGGRLADTDISFSVGYLITQEGNENYTYLAEVEYEFSRGRQFVEEEIVETAEGMLGVASYRRSLSRGDADLIRRLLTNI